MARKTNEKRLQQTTQLLKNKHGYKSGEYARIIRQTSSRLLVQLNDQRVHLSEDRKGRLWPLVEIEAIGEVFPQSHIKNGYVCYIG